MICPWIKETRKYVDTIGGYNIIETFADCWGHECPWYRPEYSDGSLIVEAKCSRVDVERDKAKGGGNHE